VTDKQLTLFGNDSEISEISDAEGDAVLADFLAQHPHVPVTTEASRAKPCVCEHPLVFAGALGGGRCGLCGRERRDR
jgi:hypothetical protein